MADRAKAISLFQDAMKLATDKSAPEHKDMAWQRLCSAVVIDPTLGEAMFHLGNGCAESGMRASAVAAWKRLLELPPGAAPGDATAQMKTHARVNLANNLHHAGRNDEARGILDGLLAEDPRLSKAWVNMSLVQSVDGELEQSLESARRGYKLDPNDAAGEMALAFACFYAGKYREGFKHFEARFMYRWPHMLAYPFPKWRGELDKDVWVVAEQGIGDTLSFARFVEPASKIARSLKFAVQPELFKLLRMAFAHLPNVTVDPLPMPFPAVDYWSSFMSLPFALGLSDEEIVNAPQFPAPAFGMASTWKAADRKFHVGISWAGSPRGDNFKLKSFPFEELLRLYDVPGIQLYSLQIGDQSRDLYNAGAAGLVRDLAPYISDVTSTLAMMADLDLVVTVESAIGHMCALVGKECWIPYCWLGRDLRIGHDGSKAIWTPRTRIFKQERHNEWAPVFKRITEALRERVNG